MIFKKHSSRPGGGGGGFRAFCAVVARVLLPFHIRPATQYPPEERAAGFLQLRPIPTRTGKLDFGLSSQIKAISLAQPTRPAQAYGTTMLKGLLFFDRRDKPQGRQTCRKAGIHTRSRCSVPARHRNSNLVPHLEQDPGDLDAQEKSFSFGAGGWLLAAPGPFAHQGGGGGAVPQQTPEESRWPPFDKP